VINTIYGRFWWRWFWPWNLLLLWCSDFYLTNIGNFPPGQTRDPRNHKPIL